MSSPTIRAALQRLVDLDNSSIIEDGQWATKHENAIADAIEALATEPVGEGPSDEEIILQAGKFLAYSDAHMGDPARWEGSDADLLAFARAILAHLTRPAALPAPEVQRDAVIAAVTEALGNAYDCQRVWQAWSVGTMGQDDFALVAEDSDRVAEIADAAIEAMRLAAPAAPVPTGDDLAWRQPGWCNSSNECWWSPGPQDPWQLINPNMVYPSGWLLPHHAIPLPGRGGGGVSKPLSPDTRAVLAAIDGYGAPRETVAQGFRALAFLRPGGPITNEQLIRIAEELDP